MKKHLIDYFPELHKPVLSEAISLPTRVELDKTGWNEERDGWYDHEGYHITISRDEKSFIAMTPDGKTIASHLRNFGLADNRIDKFKKDNPDY